MEDSEMKKEETEEILDKDSLEKNKQEENNHIITFNNLILNLSGEETEAFSFENMYETCQKNITKRQEYGILAPNFLDILQNCFRVYANEPYLGIRKINEKEYYWYTYQEIEIRIKNFSSGLINLQISKPGDFLGISGPNSIEWIITDFSCVYQNITSVPLAPTLDQPSTEHIINNSDIICVVCSVTQCQHFYDATINCPKLTALIIMDIENESEIPIQTQERKLQIYFLKKIEAEGAKNNISLIHRNPEAIHSLVYTSGSTGVPKGAIMTEKRWTKFVSINFSLPYPLVHISYAPLAHVMERQNFSIITTYGGRIGMFSKNMSFLFEDIQCLQPTFIAGAPRLFNQIYSDYQRTLSIAKQKFNWRDWQLCYTDQQEPFYFYKPASISTWYSPHQLLEIAVLRSFRSIFGGKIQFIITGGAITGQAIIEFLEKCFQCPIFNGYGTTETGGISNNSEVNFEAEIKLRDVPELNYTSKDLPYPRGEILVKTPYLVDGYYKNEKASQESFVDGYFCTGDIGQRLPGGKIQIIDRKKHVLKLQQGEFVAPENLENIFIQSKWLKHIYIHGDPLKSYLLAIVYPNQNYVNDWILENKITVNKGNLNSSSEIKLAILQDFHKIGKQLKLNSFEIPKKIYLVNEDFTPENELLTTSLKNRRNVIAKKYEKEIERLWNETSNVQIQVAELAAKIFGKEFKESTSNIDLESLGADSLSTVRFYNLLKEKLSPNLSLQEFMNESHSINDIAQIVEFQTKPSLKEVGEVDLQVSSQFSSISTQANKDLTLKLFGQINTKLFLKEKENIKDYFDANPTHKKTHYLLTGSTGFLGSFLLKTLLSSQRNSIIYCLIRSKNIEEGKTKLQTNLSKYDIDINIYEQTRITVIPGDLSKHKFGLFDEEYEKLAEKIEIVYHCGAIVNWIFSYDKLRSTNVLGTLEILQFCFHQKIKPLHYISTIGVAGNSEKEMLDKNYLHYLNGYSLTKYVAEQLVWKAVQIGFPATIFRPGMIAGNSKNGACNPSDYLNRYLIGIIKLGYYINSETWKIDLSPVDWVASCCIEISFAHSSEVFGKAFHLVNTSPPSYAFLGRCIKESGYPDLVALPYEKWKAKLDEEAKLQKQNPKEMNPLLALINYFSDTCPMILSPQFSSTNVLNFLKKTDPTILVSPALLRNYLNWMKEKKVLN